MPRATGPNLVAVPLSVIAGLGHLVIGRARRGFFLFMTATMAWNIAALSWIAPVAPLGGWSLRLGIAAGAGLTLFAVFDAFRLGVYARLPSVTARRERQLKAAVDHYLRRENHEARELLDRILDVDPADPAARLYLATLERRAGNLEQAIHHARKALSAASTSPFAPEIERELHLAKESRRGP